MMRSFSKSDRGDEVVDIQIRLSKLGYNLGPSGVDGSFGDATEAAVVMFQRDRDLFVDGVVSDETWRALVEATYKLGDRLIYLRSPFFRGDDVKELQRNLNTLGFNTGQVDGVYGETTERAVREYQRNLGLQSDGIFGPSTHAAIENFRHLLKSEASAVYPDPHRNQDSALSIFENRLIVVNPIFIQYELEGPARDSAVETNRDLGIRLGNLLELLGARVVYLDGDAIGGFDGAADIYIEFSLNIAEDEEHSGSVVHYDDTFDEGAARSQVLAKILQDELVCALELQDLGVERAMLDVKPGQAVAAVRIKPFFSLKSDETAFLEEEILRQKIAVAVFDGISSYLQLY
ncbi:MAG: peptidoglycan-binding protein [Actinobacteria bacterium]|nr:peptidoglycan-binding protein [Actinomycetota bacterium]